MAVALNRQAISLRQANSDEMAHVTLAAPITGLSGKLSKSHAVVFNMRQAPTSNERMISMPCYTNYRDPMKKVKLTDNQKTWNTKFAEIARMTRERLEDPAFMASDQASFIKQSKFKTIHAFVFHICKEELVNGK